MTGPIETPVVFSCGTESLLGIVHQSHSPCDLGVLTVVAGGPQYRAGVGRGLVSLGRELSARGVHVMRFDHRGLGDSSGEFLGFEHLAEDIQAAIYAFQRQVPELKRVVLWGGCDAASGIMIHACKLPEVVSVVVGNPFVSSEVTQAAVTRRHYFKRLGEWSFWRKVLSFEYDFGAYFASGLSKLGFNKTPAAEALPVSSKTPPIKRSKHFIDKMLYGLEQFNGSVLFLMSGQSLVSKEFDELVARAPAWEKAYGRRGNKRVDLPDADQAFSSQDSKAKVNEAILQWVEELATTRDS